MATRTVLIVGDDEVLWETLAFALEKKGYRVLHAGGGESLDLARREQPAMILLDLNMPDLDGAEISACLHGDARTAHIPVVAMSGEAGQRRARAMIAQDWLRKPFSVRVLYETVARWAVPLDAAYRPVDREPHIPEPHVPRPGQPVPGHLGHLHRLPLALPHLLVLQLNQSSIQEDVGGTNE